jgi:hypothetical protein
VSDILKKLVPTPVEMAREGIIVLAGILMAAFVISRFPAVQKFVSANALTIKDGDGRVLY